MRIDSLLTTPVLAVWTALSPMVAGAAAPAAPGLDEARLEPMKPRDVFALEYASDPQIAPDGQKVVYVRNFMDVMTDRRRSNLWIVDVASGAQRPLTSGEANHSSPRWSPDGGRLAWISNAGGSSQIHVRWMDSGETAGVTRLERGPSDLAWSPAGDQLAFTCFVPEPEKPYVEMPARPEGAEWAPAARVVRQILYRDDGAGYRELGHTHLFVVPAEGNAPRQLTHGAFDCQSPCWMPDGTALVFSTLTDEVQSPQNSDLWSVSLDGTLDQLTDRNGPDSEPAVSPDGSSIAFVGFDDERLGYQPQLLWLAAADGSGATCLTTTLDRSVESPTWSADGRRVYVSFADHGNTKIGFVDLTTEDRRFETITGDLGGTSLGRPYGGGSFSVAWDGAIAFTHTRPDHPADVALVSAAAPGSAETAEVRLLTSLNADLFAGKTLASVRPLEVTSSFDERPIQTWLALPPAFDETERYPLLLEIHGGPFADYGDRFAAEIQLYAAAGYVVVYANPRGSTSYGKEFGNLIHHAYPGEDYDDLMSAVDAAIALGFVDPERLFVTGGSGGGVLTAWIVGKTDRFRAAVVAKPVINWTSFALTADASHFFWRYWFPGPPWEHFEHYWKRSPLSLVGNVSTPTMVLTGEVDYRTPISESEQFYSALAQRGVDTAFVRIPEASHGITARPSHLIAKVLHVLAWFAEHDVKAEER